ncbi:tail fiber protein [Planctomycetota bacterium]|nr:tail fiber protein [Planctomycetota bacterium]
MTEPGEPFIGEIRIWANNFVPKNWAYCNGQLLNIMDYVALFSIIGTTYGGDGRQTFAVPNLQGRAPMQQGNGSGLSPRRLAENTGTTLVSLTEQQMPDHDHSLNGSTLPASTSAPDSTAALARAAVYEAAEPNVDLNAQSLVNAGGSQPHNNMQPYLSLSFCIALEGVVPSRS